MRVAVLLALAVGAYGLAPAAPDPYQVFADAQASWEMRAYPRYIAYDITVTVSQRGKTSASRYHAFYDARDGDVVTSGISDEEREHPYVPRGINTYFNVFTGLIPLSAPQHTFDFLGVPRLSPVYSFGIARSTSVAGPLQGAALVNKIRKDFNDPAPRRSPISDAAGPLRVIASVEATRRRYVIALAGTEAVNGHSDYHLTLVPLQDPYVYRLRDVWVNTADFSIDKLIVQGNFREGEMDRVKWLVSFDNHNGAPPYIASEQSLAPFSFDRRHYDSGVVTFQNIRESATIPPRLDFNYDAIGPGTGTGSLTEP